MNAWFQSTEAAWRLAGWTMLDYLWIGAAAAAVGAAFRWACRRGSSQLRYAASLITLLVLAILPAVIAAWLNAHPVMLPATVAEMQSVPVPLSDSLPVVSSSPSTPAATSNPVSPSTATEASPTPATSAEDATTATNHSNPLLADSPPATNSPLSSSFPASASTLGLQLADMVGYLPWLWIIGAPITFALLSAGLVGSQRLRRSSVPIVDGAVAEACRRLSAAMRLTRRVAIAACDGISQPILVGIVRPMILLPAAALSGWTPEELEMVLAHELAHVRRWDNLVNLLQRVVESLLFFHPAVWLVSRQVRRDREECCDAAVVALTQRPEAYASLLVSIAASLRRGQAPPLAVASAMADHPLAGRLRRILKLPEEPMWISRGTLAALAVGGCGIVGAVLLLPAVGRAVDEQPAPVVEAAAPAADEPPAQDNPPSRVAPKYQWADFASPDGTAPVSRRYLAGTADRLLLQNWLNILIKTKLPVQWSDNGSSLEVNAPLIIHNGIREFLRDKRAYPIADDNIDLTSLTPDGADDEEEPLRRLFVVSEFNEQQTKEYSLAEWKDQLSSYPDTIPDLFEGLQKDPYGPELSFTWKWIEKNKRIEITAPRAAHLAFHALLAAPRLYQASGKNQDVKPTEPASPAPVTKKAAELLLKVYPAGDIERVDFKKWMKAVAGNDQVTLQWDDEHQPARLLVRAPQEVHATISELFSEARAAGNRRRAPATEAAVDWLLEQTETEERHFPADVPTAEIAKVADRLRREGKTVSVQRNADGSTSLFVATEIPPTPASRLEATQNTLAGRAVNQPAMPGFQVFYLKYASANSVWFNLKDYFEPQLKEEDSKLRFIWDPDSNSILAQNATESQLKEIRDLVQVYDRPKPKPETVAKPLAPGDAVVVKVLGAYPDQPIDGTFTVEPQGTLALGPAYGRIEVAGKTVLEAEKVVEEELKKTLKDSAVQITQPPRGQPTRERGESQSIPASYYYHSQGTADAEGAAGRVYDGRTFAQWRDLWKNELKTEKRTEAINALAAFGRAGMGREAVEAILDVAGQYDFSDLDNKQPEGRLKLAVIAALTDGVRPAINPAVWLPVLRERVEKSTGDERQRWLDVQATLVRRVAYPNQAAIKELLELAKGDNADVAREAIRVLLNFNSVRDPEVIDFARAQLAGDKPNMDVLAGLQFLYLDNVPEQLNLLFHRHPQAQLRAREILSENASSMLNTIVDALIAVLDDPQRSADHVAAIRALSACRRSLNRDVYEKQKDRVIGRLEQVLREGERESLTPAIAAILAITYNAPFGEEYPNIPAPELGGSPEISIAERVTSSSEVSPERAKELVDAANVGCREEFRQIVPLRSE